MRKIKSLVAVLVMAMCSVVAMAQTVCPAQAEAEELGYLPQPYTFIQVQGGINTTFTNGANFLDLVNPTASIGVGRMFTPVVGARLHFNGWQTSSWTHCTTGNTTCKYKFKYLTSDIDVLVNLTNIWSKKHNNLVNLYFVGGLGLSYAWDNAKFTEHEQLHRDLIAEDISNAWGKGTNRESLLSHNVRAGLMLDFNVSKALSVNVEADVNSLSDRFNSKYNDADDWMMTAQIGLTYKFGHKKYEKKPAPVVAVKEEPKPVVKEEPKPEPKPVVEEPAPAPVAKPQPKPETAVKAVVKEEPLKEVIFYQIRESQPTDEILNKVIAWCNKYPEKSVTVDGYADAGTGNPALNVKYAEARATKVADALKAKGLAADRIVVKSYGDTVQPYAENDKNRCVIIVGK